MVTITCSSDEDVMLMWKDLEVDPYGFSHILFVGWDDVEIIPTPCAFPPPRSVVVVNDDEIPVIVVEDDDFLIVVVEEASSRKRMRETSVEPTVELILDSTPHHQRDSWVKMEEFDISNIDAEEEYHSNNSSEGEPDDEFVPPQGGGFSKDADNAEDKDAKAWLDNAKPVQTWARSQFDHTSKSDHITNNFSESFNKRILELREKPIVTFIDGLHITFMKNIYDRKHVANELGENKVLPRVKKLIAKYVKLINNYIVRGSSTDHVYMVRTQYGIRWEVNLVTKECSCIKWQLSGLPCVHAVAALHPMRCDWVDYTHPYMSVRAYKETYAGSIRPMVDLNDWDKNVREPIIVLPPPFVRGIGRPKKNRKRAPDEPARIGKVRHCKGVLAPKKKYTKKGKKAASTSSNEPTPITLTHQQQQPIATTQRSSSNP
ncbi:hypothetical protein IFM89_037516 [Coptis chinensis]|uniref:SWIM-type domain-containing protein n=1 Tax=Coptis chinensis TaxID=261450 RepID=A0A835ITI1_9MAGN|nr:hypothetical protein IFM89_037516 [Coptis chinensis]